MSAKKRGLQGGERPVKRLTPDPGQDADRREPRGHPLASSVARDETALRVPIDLVAPDPGQPRKRITQESIERLAADIEENGLLNPLTVVEVAGETGSSYRIVAGGRRFAALQRLGVRDVPVRVVSPDSVRVLQLAENLQRKELPILEEAHALRELQAELGASIRTLAQRLHMSRGYVERRLKVPDWPEDLRALLEEQPGWFSRLEEISRIEDEGERARQVAALKGEPAKPAPRKRTSASTQGRPVTPFRFKEKKNGGFDVTIKFRPGQVERDELVTQLREVLARLEASRDGI